MGCVCELKLARAHGYVFVPDLFLDEAYPGARDGVAGAEAIRTWWIRYFDWL